MLVSIGVLTYKRMDNLLSLLNDMKDVTQSFEIILLNNNEDIDIYPEIASFIDRRDNISLQYIWDKTNYGVCLGRKRILDVCRTPYLILLDDDVHVPCFDELLDNVVNNFETDDSLGGAAFRILEYKNKIENRYEIPHKNKKINTSVDFYTYLMIGAGMALRVSSARKAGGFSDFLGPYGFEEVDISFKIINEKFKIKYLSKCVIEHKKSPDGRFSNKSVNYYAFVNRTLMAKKYFKRRYYYSCLLVRSVFFLLKENDFRMYVKALSVIFSFKERSVFTQDFYSYCKKVNAFLYF
ncbi:glycosyltransferase family 2 protein [Pectobacterium parvum]|uniref:Glycosyltransferase n=1 Tax=Pectobacterium parvum TaxID=2778550 RepID=A0AAP9IK17_9GAMM|nr:glycosyltransferase [Pectobacterium parvum]QHQ25098.1 glycosyltransferase [Pectobacterium parvum]